MNFMAAIMKVEERNAQISKVLSGSNVYIILLKKQNSPATCLVPGMVLMCLYFPH